MLRDEAVDCCVIDIGQRVTFSGMIVPIASSFIKTDFLRGERGKLGSVRAETVSRPTFLQVSLITPNWQAFQMSLILITPQHNVTVTTV